MTPRSNARLVLDYVEGDTAVGRACRRAAEDVLRLENVRAAAKLVLLFEYPRRGSEGSHPHQTGRKVWRSLAARIEESE